MSESNLYKEGGTIIYTSNVNKRNAELAQEYKRKMEAENAANMYDRAREEGMNEAYMDVMQRLSQANNQYTPIQEGSPQDIHIQEGVDAGINYREPQEPGLLDAVSNRLGQATNWVTSRFEQPEQPEQQEYVPPYNEFAERDKADLMRAIQEQSFQEAVQMGDTSEANVNRILTKNYDREGL